MKKILLVLGCLMSCAWAQNGASISGIYNSAVSNPFELCSKPKPTTQPLLGLYENICNQNNNIAQQQYGNKFVQQQTAIYGHCGPVSNSCATGKFVDVADDATRHIWVCQGYNEQGQPHGNYSESCSAKKDTPVPAIVPSVTQGIPKYQPVEEKPAELPTVSAIYGHCGPAKNSCALGRFVDVADDETRHIWVCQGYDSQGQPHGNYSESCSVGK